MTLFWIGIIILGVGLIQSVLSLFKDFSKKHKERYKIAQIVVFILLFFSGIISLIITNKNNNEDKILQTNIYTKVSDQMNYLNNLVKNNDTLIKKSESINNHLLFQNKLTRSLVLQYEHVNYQLSKQIDLDFKKFTSEAPKLIILDKYNGWIKRDTNSYELSVCIGNIGKRTASIQAVLGYALFYGQNQNFVTNFVIRNTTKQYLSSVELGNSLSFLSDQTKDLKTLKNSTKFGIILIEVRYRDEILKKDSIITLESGWDPIIGFGKVDALLIPLAKKWTDDNKVWEVMNKMGIE